MLVCWAINSNVLVVVFGAWQGARYVQYRLVDVPCTGELRGDDLCVVFACCMKQLVVCVEVCR